MSKICARWGLTMMPETLTEAEFQAFAERLRAFAQDLIPKERQFLTAILVRASMRTDPDPYPWDPELTICTDLAYSIWQTLGSPYDAISVNPQPLPSAREGSQSQR
jgi:hypothetical protein